MESIWNNSKREIDREGYKQPMKIVKKCDERGREYEKNKCIKGRKERRKERRKDWTKKGSHREVKWCLCGVFSMAICCSFV